ncbi:MAG: NAD(P)-dependent oxidoreductase [Chloroflexi bacterium]|nr:NAD(P)-dependent oxidoreductase [Chloroflexota bacterium]
MKIGLIGTGKMGSGMGANILKAGHELTVHDAKKTATDELVNAGAKWANSPKTVAQASEIVVLSLPGPAEVEQVVLGANGVLAGAKPGCMVIDTSTNSPSLVRRLAGAAREKGVALIDAPVSGEMQGARAGTLTFMVGGNKKDFDRSAAVLMSMGKAIVHVGDVGAGDEAKLIHNMIAQINMQAVAEGMALGAKLGMDLKKLNDILSSGGASSRILTQKYPRNGFIGNFEPGFRVDLSFKDLNLASNLGKEVGVPLFFGNLALQRLVELQARGHGAKDTTSCLLPFEEMLNIKIRV